MDMDLSSVPIEMLAFSSISVTFRIRGIYGSLSFSLKKKIIMKWFSRVNDHVEFTVETEESSSRKLCAVKIDLLPVRSTDLTVSYTF